MTPFPVVDKARAIPGAPVILWTLLLTHLFLAGGLAGQATPPDARYRTFDTSHFRVTFPEGLDEVAERAAERAERAHEVLRQGFLPPPRRPIELLVLDHTDLSNGFASVSPSNRIVIWASPPVDGLALSHHDDWLELVVFHEVVHIFHLDHTGRIGRLFRGVFGRPPHRWPYFSGYTLPTLGIEGLAVHMESRFTGGGRVHGSLHEAVIRARLLEGEREKLGEGMGRSPIWPGGERPYVFGGLFFRYLADTFGDEALTRFLEGVAGQWIPYRLNAAARDAFGAPLTSLWEGWMDGMEAEAFALREALDAGGRGTPLTSLTPGGRTALYPAPGPGGVVAYLRADGRSDTRLVLHDGEGERTLTRWNGISPPTWTPEGELLVPGLEYEGPYHLYRDLYRVTVDGEVRRLTRGLRVTHADAHPVDGRVVAVAEGEGVNRLLLLSPEGALLDEVAPPAQGVLWSYPRWSPDGSRVVVTRRRAGGVTGIVVLDLAGGGEETLHEDAAMNTTPTWSPDGEWVVWSSDRSGVANLLAAPVRGGPLRQITHLATAGSFPAVSRDGEWLLFSHLTADGWEVARTPWDPEGWSEPDPTDPRFAHPHGRLTEGEDLRLGGVTRPYSSLPTLLPRYWLPTTSERVRASGAVVLPLAVGIETSGRDLIGRHVWSLEASVPVEAGARTEATGVWRWAGLGNPVVVVDGSRRYRSGGAALAGDASQDTVYLRVRETGMGGTLEFRRQRVRSTAVVTVGGRTLRQSTDVLERGMVVSSRYRLDRPERSLGEVRIGVGVSTARSFPFSISPERGVSVSAAWRERWEWNVPDTLAGVRGGDGRLRDFVFAGRGYTSFPLAGFARHVVGVRGALGVAGGPGAGRGHFGVGGGGGGGGGSGGFTWDAPVGAFAVRGHPAGVASGTHAWGAGGEWRFPLALLHQGFGALPFHLDRLSGGVFLDAGGSFGDLSRNGGVTFASTGGELILTHSRFFGSPLTLRGGVAIPVAGGGSASLYAGYGLAF